MSMFCALDLFQCVKYLIKPVFLMFQPKWYLIWQQVSKAFVISPLPDILSTLNEKEIYLCPTILLSHENRKRKWGNGLQKEHEHFG